MSDARTKALEFKAKGNEAFKARDFSTAVEHFSKAIEHDPSDHVFFSNRSACYLSMGEAGKALEDAEKCVALKPDWGKGYSRKGAALQSLGKLEEAVAAFDAGLAHDSGSAALQSGRAQAAESLRRKEAAAGAGAEGNPFGAMAKMFGPQLIPTMMANPSLKGLLEDSEFMGMLQEVQGDPNKLMTHLADPRMQLVLREAMGINISGGPGAAAAGDDAEAAKEKAAAARAARAKAEEEAAAEAARAAETEEERAEREAREAEAREAAEKKAKAEAVKARGNEAYKSKDFASAIAAYDEAYAIVPDATYLNNRAAAELESGDVDKCLRTCEQALKETRDFDTKAKVFARIGAAHAKAGRLAEAETAYRNSLLENHSKAVERKLALLRKKKKKAETQAYLDPAKALEAKEKGNELFRAGKFPQAVEAYSEAIKRDPTDAKYYQNRAAAYSKVMDFQHALEDCNKALALDPKFVRAWGRKGQIEVFLKKFHRAIESFRAGLEIDSQDPACTQGLQNVMSRINEHDPERAQRAMEDPEIQALMRDPVVSQVLESMKQDPKAAQAAMRDADVAKKLETLIAAGILRLG